MLYHCPTLWSVFPPADPPYYRVRYEAATHACELNLPVNPLRFTNSTAAPGNKHAYRVVAVNTVGLKSKPSADATPGDAR